jgi:hypothetical protein
VVVVLALAACFKSEFVLKGEVFVVTKGAQNVRLGRLGVYAFEPSDFNAYFNQRVTAFTARYTELMGKWKANDAEMPSAIERAKANRETAYRRSGTWDEAKTEALAKSAEKDLASLESSNENIQAELTRMLSGQFFFESLPAPQASAVTDSEGKYQITLPKNKPYIIVAAGTYLDDDLFWVIHLPPTKQDNADLTLSNDNQVRVIGGKPVFP